MYYIILHSFVIIKCLKCLTNSRVPGTFDAIYLIIIDYSVLHANLLYILIFTHRMILSGFIP